MMSAQVEFYSNKIDQIYEQKTQFNQEEEKIYQVVGQKRTFGTAFTLADFVSPKRIATPKCDEGVDE